LVSSSTRFVYEALALLNLPLPFRAHTIFTRNVFATSLSLLAQMKGGPEQSAVAAPFRQVSAEGLKKPVVGEPYSTPLESKGSYYSSVCY
jgi:hypothetical protein